MKARGAAIQGGLAVAALVVAYATWQRPEQAEEWRQQLQTLKRM